jgi:hypothetical protein
VTIVDGGPASAAVAVPITTASTATAANAAPQRTAALYRKEGGVLTRR